MDRAAIEWITGTLLTALADGDAVDAVALTFLLRRYGETGRADVRGALEAALAGGLERQATAETIAERAAWLALFTEALGLSFDERLLEAATALIASLRRGWGRTAEVDVASLSVDAALRACGVLDPASIAPEAVDELERIVAAAYRPGEGLAHNAHGRAAASGQLADHVGLASALLTAYEISGRLPYPMLAEELVQFARRTHWSEQAGCFEIAGLDRREMFRLNCEASRVFSRLAALHGDADYRAAAVIRPDEAYGDEGARMLDAQEATFRQFGVRSAVYGLALTEWRSVQP